MHYHLEPVGGIAGDMFAAAMLDRHRDWQDELAAAIARSALADRLAVRAASHSDGLLTGHRFVVTAPAVAAHADRHPHRHWSEIRQLLLGSRLAPPVLSRAIAIFELLAQAEAEVHGQPVEAVGFHEVGAWDSIADIVSAAWLIERSGATGWSCSGKPGSDHEYRFEGQNSAWRWSASAWLKVGMGPRLLSGWRGRSVRA